MRKRIMTIAVVLLAIISTTTVKAQKFEQPILISSAGQSADVKLVKMLAQRQKWLPNLQ